MHPFVRTILAALLAFWLPASAGAQDADLQALVDGLAAKSFNQKIDAVDKLAATGDPKVVPVLTALLEGRLFTLKDGDKLVIAERKGRVYVTTAPLGGANLGEVKKGDLTKVRVNNKLRGELRAALGGLTLLSPDPSVRAEAVDSVLKARDAELMPVLEKAMAREEDPALHARMALAHAATNLFAAKKEEARLEALARLSESATPEVRSLLNEFVAGGKGTEKVIAAAKETLEAVEGRLRLWETVGDVFRGISLGSVLLLAAVGLAITFGVMGVINMAHGEMVMLGAYTTFVVQEAFRAYAPGAFDLSLVVAVPAAFLVSGAVGIAIERGVIRFLYGRPLETLLATWGISLVLQQAVRSVFGPTNRDVGAPEWMSGAVEFSNGLLLTYNRLWIIAFSLVVVGGIVVVLRKTAFGLQMRAVTQNRAMANSMGIRTGAVDALTFGMGSGIAGIAGVALSQIDNVSPNLGQAYIIDSFMVVVFGGVGNIWGTVVGAFSLGIVNKFLEPVAGAVLAKILVLIAIILFIQKRPRGLFALKGRAVEA
ncbi:MAG: urea ABC transporter permease subunit UrtB [Hyphomicrobiales bacterium]|nr:urea ABC transporter permease subunit UrtB [Hyphomicrobiales bacterium]